MLTSCRPSYYRFVYQQQATRTLSNLQSLPDRKGLDDVFVYEVLDDNTGFGSVNVSAKQYSVDCTHPIKSTSIEADPNSDYEHGLDWVVRLDIDGSGETSGMIYLRSMCRYRISHSSSASTNLGFCSKKCP